MGNSGGGTGVERRPGHNVASLSLGGAVVDVHAETGVAVAVGTGEGDELGGSGCEVASASDLDLSALRVELLHNAISIYYWEGRGRSDTYSGQGVEGNSLEPDEVVAGRDGLRDGGRPGGVVSDHHAVTPLAVEDRAREETSLVDLEPLERVGIDTRARRARAFSEVCQLNEVLERHHPNSYATVSPLGRWHAAKPGSSTR